MGFETPLALLALAAAAAPVIAHLLRRQDLPTIKLPTVALLRRAEAASRRRVRVVDWLLLVVRVLLLAVLALAVAGPTLQVILPYGDGEVSSVALVIDDSMSAAHRGSPSPLERSLARAAEVLSALPPESEAAVILAGSPARVLVSRTDDPSAAGRALLLVPPRSARGTDLEGALRLADRELAGARHARREVLVLGDRAAHAYADWDPPGGLTVRIEPGSDPAPTSNAAVVSARAAADPTRDGVLAVAIEVRGSEDLAERRLPVEVVRGGESIASGTVELRGGVGRVTLAASIDPADPAATVVLDVDDSIDVDDRRGVLLRGPSAAQLLLVEGGAGATSRPRFLGRAIDLLPESAGAFTRRAVDPDTFETTDLTGFDVIVLNDAPTPSARAATRLRTHVEAGGGLLVAVGERLDARALDARLGEVLPARVRAEAGLPGGSARGLSGSGDRALAGVRGLSEIVTRRRALLEDLAPGVDSPLRFADGSPALVLGEAGLGRVALFTTTLDDGWTTLPYRPGYLPLLAGLLQHLAPRRSSPDRPFEAGATVSLGVPLGATHMTVTDPSGTPTEFAGDELAGDTVEFGATLDPGVYRVSAARPGSGAQEAPGLAFVVAPPAQESDLTPADPGALAGGARQPDRDAPATGSTIAQRPLARWFFLAFGVLAVCEGLLRRHGAKGPEPARRIAAS